MGADERAAVVAAGAATAEVPAAETLHGLFAAQAARTPDAVAVRFEDRSVTYAELDARAGRLARRLRALGVGPETRVGLCVERSPETVAGILGILKAGGGYVPLDPAYPDERLAYMLDDSAVPVVVTTAALAEKVAGEGRALVVLDGGEDWADAGEDLPAIDAGPGSLAYVIYTSGSTGRPKGVEVTHGNVVRLMRATEPWFGFGSGDVWTLFHSYAFDFSVWELWGALLHGGRLVVVPFLVSREPEAFYALLERERVTVLNQTPSAFRQLMRADEAAAARGAMRSLALRYVVFGGEALEPGSLRGWVERRGDDAPRLVNMYGITETTVHVTCRVLRGADVAAGAASPIGVPLPDLSVHLLDARGEPVPVGVVGEMHVGGAGVARGYLGRPELTSRRFVPDPFSAAPGARLYRSGDLARRLADGSLEFLGRADEQVKVRGFRIEPGEVASVLLEHPAVREAVVVVRGEGDARRLVAYVVPAPGVAAPPAAELRAHAAGRLPEYMVPAAFVAMDALPVTRNGKVDRRALPDPEPDAGRAYLPPRTPTEEILASAWAELLEVERVGADDDFFALGGHSLLATRVVSRVREALGVELPLRTLFEAPDLGALAAAVDALLREGAGVAAPPVRHVEHGVDAPLSFAQERLWFVDRMEPGSPVYHMPSTYRLVGPLDVDALRRAVEALVRRHETLRTSFPEVDGVPVQRVAPAGPVDVPVHDLSHLPEEERGEALHARARENAMAPFDLAAGPVFRASLVRMAPDDHALLFNLHHVVSDGWSLGILSDELSALYGAFSRGEASPLAELPVQYADYALWQRDWLRGEVLERQVDYWRRKLGGAPPLLELPTDRPRPAVQTHTGAAAGVLLPREAADRLLAFTRAEGVTLFMALLAAFDVVLARLSGQDDVVVGTPVAGRTRAETEGLIGLFLNSLALRTDLSGEPTFRELLRRVRETTLEAYAHQDLPFERLLEELQPKRSLSHTPVFQVMLNLLNFEEGEIAMPGLEVRQLGSGGETGAKFDLTIYAGEAEDGVGIHLVYNADLFDAPRMEGLLMQVASVLDQGVAAPETPVARLSLVTEEARALLPDPAAPLSAEWRGSVPAVFARHAARTPDALSAEDGAERWTYREMDEASSRIANRLIASGVRPGDVVAVYAHRSAAMVRALLGVLKGGAAFLALDPAYPPSRLAEYARIAKPAAFLRIGAAGEVPAEVEDALRETSRCTVVLGRKVEDEVNEVNAVDGLADVSAEAPSVEIGPDSLAYLSFTSGTTGTPKAVMGRHGSLTHFTPWLAEEFDLTSADRFSLLSGLAHDPLHRDVFTPLQLGASVVAPDPEEIGTPGYLAAWLREARVTVAHLTPAMGQLIADAPEGETIPSLRRAFFVGDVLRRGDVERLVRLAPKLTVINYYGSTETQRAVGYHVVRLEGDDRRREVIPLGKGIPDVQLLVVNAAGEPAGVGEVGEVWLRSPHVALGYLNDPALTAERFLRNPWGTEEGDRLYRTGDLGRYRPDGEVEPMGRADGQVKVRGFRVELGEIEAALARHPSVREAVVVARETRPGERHLVAYVVPSGGDVDLDALRAHLRAALPEFMVPAAFRALDRLPLTANGKIDRRALPDVTPEASDDRATTPRTETEAAVAAIWREVLGRDVVGVSDDFFSLGGHSLRATQVLSRVQQRLGVKLPVKAFFADPTVGGLAEAIDANRTSQPEAETVSAPVEEDAKYGDGVYPLSFAQQRLWLLGQIEPTVAYNMPTALRFGGALDVWALERALEEIVRRHETLRTTIELQGDEPVQVVHSVRPLRLRIVDVPADSEDALFTEYRRLAAEEARAPFPAAGPFARARLLRGGEGDHVLLWTTHHIVSDGWSNGVFMGELMTLYHAFAREEASPLPPLPTQYGEYAARQRRELAGAALERQVAYWTDALAGAPTLLDLPTDRPRPAVQSGRGASFPFALPEGTAARVGRLARAADATPFMVLLAAFGALLSRWSGQDDVVVGTPIANRTRPEVEGLIGFFANTLALRTDLSGDPGFRALVGRVREATLGAYDHQDLPFEKLVEELRPERSLSHTPVFQVMLTLQNAPRAEGGEGPEGLTIGGLAREKEASAFDLTLQLFEAGGEMYGFLEYATDLFDRETMERLVAQLATLLDSAAADPSARLSDLSIVPDEDRALVVSEWNRTEADYPRELCIHDLIAEQAARTPDAVALELDGVATTYAELDRQAAALARRLHALGVRPETRVGVSLERGPAMVVAMLAALEAGGAYVPLDPAYPRERLAYMVEDSGVAVLLTQSSLVGDLPETAVPVVLLDGDADSGDDDSSPDPAVAVDPRNAAYVIYTSGSTGKPKGVVVPHGAVVNFLASMAREPGLSAGDRLLAVTTNGFDISVLEIFLPLTLGATVVLADRETTADGARLRDLASSSRATAMQATPATWRMLGEAGWTAPAGMTLLCGGEALPRELADALTAGGAALWNMYGPTETTVWSTTERVAPGEAITIGRPIANTRVYVLDARFRPAPVGVPGELCIGGDGVTRGYLGRPGMTAERFVPDPFASTPGARIYRTGDRARWRPDGRLEYLGRLDAQVKVRGHRIEPGEIESALLRHPSVRQAVVVARETAPGDVRLVAYLVAAGEPAATGELRAHLRAGLPEYMVPSAFVWLDAIPLTKSGKVDRRALPAPDRDPSADAYVAPRDETEAGLAEVWAEVLGVSRVGATDNFFDLGGHSLLAVRLMSRVRQRFGRELPLGALFQRPTLAEFAALLAPDAAEAAFSPLVPIRPEGAEAPIFVVHPAGGTVFRYAHLARHLPEGRPVYGVQAVGVAGEAEPLGSVEEMAARYVEAVREAQPRGPYLLSGWSAGGVIAFAMAHRLRAAGEEVALVALIDADVPREDWATLAPDDVELMRRVVRDLGEPDEEKLEAMVAALRAIPAEDRLQGLREWIARSGLPIPDDQVAQIGRTVKVFDATVRAVNAHRLEPYDGRVLLLRAELGIPGHPDTRPGGLAGAWRPFVARELEVRDVPGTHGTVVSEPHVQAVAAALAEALAKTGAEPRTGRGVRE
ncbi:MAG TPA: amino acid adenylation domain-containing protein [Longimicrobium sp.]|nr:amino acid adenylation domain-containing protein [Longimicrobium sp.]